MDSQLSEVENPMRQLLQKENEMLKKLLDEKESHIASLKQAMLMLDHKEENQKKLGNWFCRLFNK